MKNNIPCQDKTCTVTRNGTTVIALADGAGSARLSHYGAEAVTNFICEELADNFNRYYNSSDGAEVKQAILSKTLDVLGEQCGLHECGIKDLSSTLLAAAVNDGRFMLFHVGDGVIGYLKNGVLRTGSQPENGEFSNVTFFTTSSRAADKAKIIKGSLNGISGFTLMSDGAEAGLYNKREKRIADALRRITEQCAAIEPPKFQQQLEQSFEEVVKQATLDDCSIIIMSDAENSYRTFSYKQKSELFRLSGRVSPGRLRRFDKIIQAAQTPQSLKCISRRIHVKPRYVRRHLERLVQLELVEYSRGLYRSLVIL